MPSRRITARERVVFHGERHDLVEGKVLKREGCCRARGFGRKAQSPCYSCQAPSDFDSGHKGRLERRPREPREPDEATVVCSSSAHSPQPWHAMSD
jgi:hypothetical protein